MLELAHNDNVHNLCAYNASIPREPSHRSVAPSWHCYMECRYGKLTKDSEW